MNKYIGYFLIFIAVAILLGVFYARSKFSRETRTFSSYTILNSSWEKYKETFLRPEGRIIDPTQNNITTSEGQSYALLRSVWIDDKSTFDKVLKWTKDNLKHKNDNLFGWKWGQLQNGSYGFLSGGGDNPASDADSDIALALILANRRWNQWQYEADAKSVLKDIWDKETTVVNGKRYLIAGPWAKNENEVIINPSYFSPYAWRLFAQVDKEHDWNSLIDPAYNLLTEAGKSSLDKTSSDGLPPDWVAINVSNGNLKAASVNNLTTDYSFDAMRIPWRIALDYKWNNNPEAKKYLDSLQSLSTFYQTGKLVADYSHDGKVIKNYENPAMYATALGYFLIEDPNTAKKIYDEKIISLYSNDLNSFRDDIPYYEQNWLWFGTALYNNYLSNF